MVHRLGTTGETRRTRKQHSPEKMLSPNCNTVTSGNNDGKLWDVKMGGLSPNGQGTLIRCRQYAAVQMVGEWSGDPTTRLQGCEMSRAEKPS